MKIRYTVEFAQFVENSSKEKPFYEKNQRTTFLAQFKTEMIIEKIPVSVEKLKNSPARRAKKSTESHFSNIAENKMTIEKMPISVEKMKNPQARRAKNSPKAKNPSEDQQLAREF